jgi:hypothetical protein
MREQPRRLSHECGMPRAVPRPGRSDGCCPLHRHQNAKLRYSPAPGGCLLDTIGPHRHSPRLEPPRAGLSWTRPRPLPRSDVAAGRRDGRSPCRSGPSTDRRLVARQGTVVFATFGPPGNGTQQSTGDPLRVARAHCNGAGAELRRWPRPRAGVRSGPEREGRSDRGS